MTVDSRATMGRPMARASRTAAAMRRYVWASGNMASSLGNCRRRLWTLADLSAEGVVGGWRSIQRHEQRESLRKKRLQQGHRVSFSPHIGVDVPQLVQTAMAKEGLQEN